MRRVSVGWLVLLCSLVMTCATLAAAPRQQFTLETSGGGVLVESFADAASQDRPAVIVLSGSKGFDAPVYDELARTFDATGLDVFLFHVLTTDDLDAIAAAPNAGARIRYYAEHFAGWIGDVEAAVAYLAARPGQGGKIGVLGISLGAQIAAAAMVDNRQVGALVLVDGGFPNDFAEPVRSMPPLQLIWGEADQTFPLSVARKLKRQVEKLGGEVSLASFASAGHDFFVRSGTTQGLAARRDAAEFLAKALGQ